MMALTHDFTMNEYSPMEVQEPHNIKEDFSKDCNTLMQELLSVRITTPYVDIMNAGKILNILSRTKRIKIKNKNNNDDQDEIKNGEWHWFYSKNDKIWCRRSEIRKVGDLKGFKEGEDYFVSDESALNFVHGQLRARGHNLTTLGQCALLYAVRRGSVSKSMETKEMMSLSERQERLQKRSTCNSDLVAIIGQRKRRKFGGRKHKKDSNSVSEGYENSNWRPVCYDMLPVDSDEDDDDDSSETDTDEEEEEEEEEEEILMGIQKKKIDEENETREIIFLQDNLMRYVGCKRIDYLKVKSLDHREAQTVICALKKNPKIDLKDGRILWNMMAEYNICYRHIPVGTGYAWSRNSELRWASRLFEFVENNDYFMDLGAFVTFIFNELPAYGHDIDGFLNFRSGNRDLSNDELYPSSSTMSVMLTSSSSSSSDSPLSHTSVNSTNSVPVPVPVPAFVPVRTLRETIKLARSLLDAKHIPTPFGRAVEMKKIEGFIINSLRSLKKGRKLGNIDNLNNLHVCGLPGYGKTLTVNYVLKKLLSEQHDRNRTKTVNNRNTETTSCEKTENESLPQFCVVDLFGTQLRDDDCYQIIARRLNIDLSDCCGRIENVAREKVLRRFCNEIQVQCLNTSEGIGTDVPPITILAIDEIDSAPKKLIKELLEIIAATIESSKRLPTSRSSASASTSTVRHSEYYGCSLILIGLSRNLTFNVDIGVSLVATEHLKIMTFDQYKASELMSIVKDRCLGLFDNKVLLLFAVRTSGIERSKTRTYPKTCTYLN